MCDSGGIFRPQILGGNAHWKTRFFVIVNHYLKLLQVSNEFINELRVRDVILANLCILELFKVSDAL